MIVCYRNENWRILLKSNAFSWHVKNIEVKIGKAFRWDMLANKEWMNWQNNEKQSCNCGGVNPISGKWEIKICFIKKFSTIINSLCF